MKILVLGCGVVGTTTAYYLGEEGHEVTVIDRCEGPGLETSFANGGQISVSHAEPWANPSTPWRALKWLGKKDAPLLFRLRLDPALWSWTLKFLANCTEKRSRQNTERALRIASYSRTCLRELRARTNISYDQLSNGILHIYRDRSEFDGAAAAAEFMVEQGLERRMISASECVEIEPALDAVKDDIVGGYFSPGDESGDAFKFTMALADIAELSGVKFRYGVSIERLVADKGKLSGVVTDAGVFQADAYVVCLGSYSPLLLRPIGINLPIYPAKGYSVTLPVENPERAPSTSLTDDENKLVYSRLGNRLRIAGTAEFTGYDTKIGVDRPKSILDKALKLFPGSASPEKAEFWTGLRPKTPDSVPIIGRTPFPNLFLNTGHGTLGWTMSCGSAKALADVISGNEPEISLSGLDMSRF